MILFPFYLLSNFTTGRFFSLITKVSSTHNSHYLVIFHCEDWIIHISQVISDDHEKYNLVGISSFYGLPILY